MKRLPPVVRRPLVLVLIGAGWLSILGNSPPEVLSRGVLTQQGAVVITLDRYEPPHDGCALEATLSTPVRKATLFDRAGTVVRQAACDGAVDCFAALSWAPVPDTGVDARCRDVKQRFRLVVETTDGRTGQVEYRVQIDPPDGYFGCLD